MKLFIETITISSFFFINFYKNISEQFKEG